MNDQEENNNSSSTSSTSRNRSLAYKRPLQISKTPGSVKRRRSTGDSWGSSTLFRTPRPMRHAFKDINKEQDDDYFDNDIVNALKGATWNLYRVSKLHKFDYSRNALKRLARLLCYRVANNLLGSAEEMTLEGLITPCETMTVSDVDAVPIRITITDTPKEEFGSKKRLVYEGVMVSCHSTMENFNDACTHLPVLLARGKAKDKVHEELQIMFDCCIHPVNFPSEEMRWMTAGWAGWLPDDESLSVHLVYECAKEKAKFTLKFQSAFIRRLFNAIHVSDNTEFTEAEMQDFHKRLMQQAVTTYGIKFYAFPLSLVKTTHFTITSQGKVLLQAPQAIPRILAYFTEYCETRLLIAENSSNTLYV